MKTNDSRSLKRYLWIKVAIKRPRPQVFYKISCNLFLSEERALRYGEKESIQSRTLTDYSQSSSDIT